jgi:hypothetical protein
VNDISKYKHLSRKYEWKRPFVTRRMRWAGHVARMWEKGNEYRILVGKSEGKKPLGRPITRWVDNVKMDLRVIEWGGMNWIDLAQDRDQWRALVNTVTNLRDQMFGIF